MPQKIKRIETALYRIPLETALSDSTHGTMTHFELIAVRVYSEDGAEGMGYTYTVGANGSAIREQIVRDLTPLLMGQEADRIEALWQRMWWKLHYGGRGGSAAFAISAVDTALWDLKARMRDEPLWRLLGGNDANVPCYAGGIDLQFPLEQLLAQTQSNLGKGFGAIKMKVGRPKLSEDVERVRAMREMLGADFPLMVDANMRWTVDEAVRAARNLQDLNVYWLEEPTIPDDVEGHVHTASLGQLGNRIEQRRTAGDGAVQHVLGTDSLDPGGLFRRSGVGVDGGAGVHRDLHGRAADSARRSVDQ